jgi:hypothetical protein
LRERKLRKGTVRWIEKQQSRGDEGTERGVCRIPGRKVQRGEMVYREGEKQRSRERETVGIFMLEGLYSHTILHY